MPDLRQAQQNSKLLQHWLTDDSFYSAKALNEKNLKAVSEKRALALFQKAAKTVPAYKDFLKKNGVKPNLIKNIDDFSQLPVTTKESYIHQYSLTDRSWGGETTNMHMISTSSGTTGSAIHWLRGLEHEIDGAYAHEYLFKTLEADKKKTLLIIGFAMGNGIAGTFTLAATNFVSWKGYPITTITPGYYLDPVIEALEKISPQFEQTIITGHSPFLKEIVETAVKKKINCKKLHLKMLGTGQAITENWRDYINDFISLENQQNAAFNIYGSSDAALMGFETIDSISIRKKVSENNSLQRDAFSDSRTPSIVSYDPRLIYFESENKELIVTKNLGCPLIRYNIHDEGNVISQSKAKSLFSLKQRPPLPLVYLFGRDAFMIKFLGANIYSEHSQQALTHKSIQKFITGKYKIETKVDEHHDQLLICQIELSEGVKPSKKIERKIIETYMSQVRKINSEYDYLAKFHTKKATPKVILHEYGTSKLFPKNTQKKIA